MLLLTFAVLSSMQALRYIDSLPWVGKILGIAVEPRQPLGGDRGFDARALLPLHIARQRVEGGAPHLHEHGVPQYPPDEYDSPLTYPLATVAAQHDRISSACSVAPGSIVFDSSTPVAIFSGIVYFSAC